MDLDWKQRKNRIFESAWELRELKPDAWRSHVDQECAGDPALAEAVLEMIEAAERAAGHESFLAGAGVIGGRQELEAIIVAASGERPERIGPYKLLQLIGEGGFGSVYMAEQQQPVFRRVALKIIKLGMDTRQVIARFEAERQALAMMDHPNIAKVFDAGATETGRPYFVMELVKGEPIVEYCDRNNLSIPDRLELFAQVCNAVQHAHTKGIIHRDLKPSNILVSTQDGKPSPKVIDFGIAKATASKLTEKTLFTEHRALIGTPEYMSPEQAEGSLDIDTRTDVYALGVLLYELLTGTTPFTSQELRFAAFAEIQRIIREVDPPKPSTRLSTNTDTIANVAARRHTEPKRLGTIVRGELDWIVMKALEKDRTRRYETASGLATDVRRYLAGEVILARRASLWYSARKLCGRHRKLVIAAAGILVSLTTGLGVSAWAWREQAVAAQRANSAFKLATELFQMFDSSEGTIVKTKDTAARFVPLVISAGAEDPERAGELLLLLASGMRAADEPERAAELAGVAVNLLLKTHGAREPQVLAATQALLAYRCIAHVDEQLVMELYKLRDVADEVLGSCDHVTIDVDLTLVAALQGLSRTADGLAVLDRLVSKCAELGQRSPDRLTLALLWKGQAALGLGNPREAIQAAEEAQILAERAFGRQHRYALEAGYLVGLGLHELGDARGAAARFAKLLPLMVESLGELDRSTRDCAESLCTVADPERTPESIRLLLVRICDAWQREFGTDAPSVSALRNELRSRILVPEVLGPPAFMIDIDPESTTQK